MKKIILTLSLTVLALLNLEAAPVSLVEARKKAGEFFGVDMSRPRLALGSRGSVSVSGLSEPAFYIFNNDEAGFVIISGDDLLDPVLGYSRTGHIDENRIPANMLFWLGQIRASVELLRKHNVPQSTGETIRRKSPSTKASDTEGKFLELPEWSQENPYNWFCPTIGPYESNKSLTGCVATAISMVMRYHQWPPCGKGTLPDYNMDYYPDINSSNTVSIPMKGHQLGHEYKWSIMPMEDFYSDNLKNPTEGQRQVAWLMYDCGIMMQASYSTEGTGAYSFSIGTKMAKYMYYKNTAKYVVKSSYGTDEWISLIKDQIDKGLPVLYGADSEAGGHQFVVHGYDVDDNLYVNWGWGGDCNGYFDVDYFYPYKDVDWTMYGYTEEEAKQIEEEETFVSGHDAVIDVEPDRSVTPVPVAMDEPQPIVTETERIPLYLEAGSYRTYQYYGISVSSGTLGQENSFKLNAGLIHNPTGTKFDGYFRFVQTDYKGNTIGKLSVGDRRAYVSANSFFYIYDIACTAALNWTLGDKICLFCSQDQNEFYRVDKQEGDSETVGEIPLIPMYFIDPDQSGRLVNGTEKYDSVEWSSDEVFEKAVISYPDGSTETILKPREEPL